MNPDAKHRVRGGANRAAYWLVCLLLAACPAKHSEVDSTGQETASAARDRPSSPALAFDTDVLVFDVTWPERKWRTVSLRGPLAQRAQLSIVGPLPHGLELEHEQAQNQNARVRVHSCAAAPGTHVGNLVFETGLEDPPRLLLPYSCRVRGTLQVEPTNPYFNLRVSGPKRVRLLVRSTEPGFRVEAAEIVQGPFATSILARGGAEEALPSDTVAIDISVREQELSSAARGYHGLLRIHSTDRSEPIKEVTLFAFGKLNADSTAP